MPGTLYIVATPIGNLQDITPRSLDVLRTVDLIACEDTRHTQKLLSYYRVSTPTISYHEHNENERAEELIDLLVTGKSVAVVSDAGTPAISDPGFRVTCRAHEAGIPVISIPGASALIAALVASGISADSFYFAGFLPPKKGDRVRKLEELESITATLVFYEAPHRLKKSLKDCVEVLGDRIAAVSRELTKIHEETVKGKISELIERFGEDHVRGEIVVVIERASEKVVVRESADGLATRFHELENEGLDRKAALKKAAKEFGIPKAEAYRLVELEKRPKAAQ